MNIHTATPEAERAEAEGNTIYKTLLPGFKQQGLRAGLFVAINIATAEFVVGETRLELMSSYKAKFGQSMGWVRQIDYGE